MVWVSAGVIWDLDVALYGRVEEDAVGCRDAAVEVTEGKRRRGRRVMGG